METTSSLTLPLSGREPLQAAALVVMFFVPSFAVSAAEEIVDVSARAGVTQSYLLSFEPEQKYTAVALLFPGGQGHIALRERGLPPTSENFVVRTRTLFLKQGIATALVDSPSDQRGMSDVFRSSRDHAADVGAIVDDVKKRFAGAKIYFVATSRGTVSAAYSAATLGERVDGVVLTSSLFNASRGGAGLANFDMRSIKAPVLFVHHRDDGCAVTPYSGAQRLSRQFPLISVAGGDSPRSGPCEPLSAHGYLGREEPVVEAISAWILGKPFSNDIR